MTQPDANYGSVPSGIPGMHTVPGMAPRTGAGALRQNKMAPLLTPAH